MEHYLYLSSACALMLLLLVLRPVNVVVALVCSLWIVAPLIADWLNERPSQPADLTDSDRGFLRGVALRTWRFFADHLNAENHWLVPDNIQELSAAGRRTDLAHESGIIPYLQPWQPTTSGISASLSCLAGCGGPLTRWSICLAIAGTSLIGGIPGAWNR